MHDSSCDFLHFRGVAQSGLARLLREQEVGGSNPPIPTWKMKKKKIIKKDGRYLIYYHFHIEFYPCYRAKNKLKYLAGSEEGAGVFIGDILPEDQASQLRKM